MQQKIETMDSGINSQLMHYKDVKGYLHNFLSNKNLFHLASTLSFGGLVLLDKLKNKIEPIPAIRFYPCLNNNKVMMAYYFDDKFDVNGGSSSCNLEDDQKLQLTEASFVYPHQVYEASHLDQFISNQVDDRSVKTCEVKGSEIKEWVNNFFSKYVYDKKPNEALCGAFEKEDYTTFISQTGVIGFHYYFGYDPAHTNYIRIILIGVYENDNKQLKNLMKIGNTDALMMQKSWPPYDTK